MRKEGRGKEKSAEGKLKKENCNEARVGSVS